MAADFTYSVVIPVYNEQEVLGEFYRRITTVCDALGRDYELLFVNDGSTDASLSILRGLQAENPRVKIITLSRNFGHQQAITAGVDHATNDAVVIIDADLQDPPEIIPQLIARWREGYAVVYAQRTARKGEGFFKRSTAHLFYRVLRFVTRQEIPEDVGDFRLIDRQVACALRGIRESHRYMRGLISWVGFRQGGVAYVRDARHAGKTKYPFRKSLLLAIDAITSFSVAPLRVTVYLGFIAVVVALALCIYVLVVHFLFKVTVQGWTSVMLALLFVGGVQLLVTGVLGEYVGKIYEEVKRRPLYIVEPHGKVDEATRRE